MSKLNRVDPFHRFPWSFSSFFRSWFFGHISRKEAEKLLLSQDLPRGAFLIRFAEHSPGGYSLTMRDWEAERGNHIKHYKIKCLDQGGFYVTTRQTFANLPELVTAYMSMSSFLIRLSEI